jgi:cytochrome c oxidase subunit 2
MRRALARALPTAAALFAATGARAAQGPGGAFSWGLPPDASLYGWRVDWLLGTTSVFVAIMFAATVVWIGWACLWHGKRHRAVYDLGSARPAVAKALVLSALIFGVVDGNLLLNGLRDVDDVFWNVDRAEADPRALRIEVNAHQWAWDIRYAGPDGKFNSADDVVTINDMRVPVGVPVVIQLAASDVIHSFSLPNFRIKQDAVPGMINRLWFQARERGRYDIACAQHCGVHHYKMRGELRVLPPEEFASWAAQASALAQRNYDPEDASGHWGWEWNRRPGQAQAARAGH